MHHTQGSVSRVSCLRNVRGEWKERERVDKDNAERERARKQASEEAITGFPSRVSEHREQSRRENDHHDYETAHEQVTLLLQKKHARITRDKGL